MSDTIEVDGWARTSRLTGRWGTFASDQQGATKCPSCGGGLPPLARWEQVRDNEDELVAWKRTDICGAVLTVWND